MPPLSAGNLKSPRSHLTSDSRQGTASAVPRSDRSSGVLTPEVGSAAGHMVCKMESRNSAIVFACAATAAILLFVSTIAVAQKKPPAKPIDFNSGTIDQLEQLPRIGPN